MMNADDSSSDYNGDSNVDTDGEDVEQVVVRI